MAEEKTDEPQEVEDKDELSSMLEGSEGKKEEGEKDESTEGEEGEKGEEKGKGETEKAGDKEPDLVEVLQGEIKDLRQMVRTSKRDSTIMQAKLKRLETEAGSKVEDDDEDDEDDENKKDKGKKEVSLSTVEKLQENIAHVGSSRGASLDILLEAMEQNSKYEDIREVCSRGNFDDIFEVIATEATKNGTADFDETLLEVELSVWNKTNPYKYMYELIKRYHPSYAKKEGAAEPGDKKKKEKTIANAPGTIADKGGDGNLKGGWTAKRIDDLPENELHTVPKDIYAKYMRDELD